MEIPKHFTTMPSDVKITFLMASILRMHHEYMSKNMKEKKITRGEFPILMLLHTEGNKTQQDIAHTFCFTESNVAKAIRNLEDKKFIQRKVDENNRRRKIVSITPTGTTVCKNAINKENKWEELITKNFSEEEKTFLKLALHKMFLECIKIKN